MQIFIGIAHTTKSYRADDSINFTDMRGFPVFVGATHSIVCLSLFITISSRSFLHLTQYASLLSYQSNLCVFFCSNVCVMQWFSFFMGC